MVADALVLARTAPPQASLSQRRATLATLLLGSVFFIATSALAIVRHQAFATGNRGLPASDYGAASPLTVALEMLSNTYITPLFDAVVDATEEAILNALLAAETMTGRNGITAYALEADALAEALAG